MGGHGSWSERVILSGPVGPGLGWYMAYGRYVRIPHGIGSCLMIDNHGGGTWLTQASAFQKVPRVRPTAPSQCHGQPSAHGSRGFPRSCGMGADLYRAGLPDDGRSCGGTALPLLSSLTTFCGCRLLQMWTSEVSDFSMVAWSGTQTSSTP